MGCMIPPIRSQPLYRRGCCGPVMRLCGPPFSILSPFWFSGCTSRERSVSASCLLTSWTGRFIFGALTGAILWNLITWWAGIPSSSSHALIGGLVGAGLTKAGTGAIVWTGLLTTGAFIVLSPLFGFFLALFL